jgi:hypothetical protein
MPQSTTLVLMRRATLACLLLFLPVTALFYWKILLTNQFSLLTESEGVNQGYSWMQLEITSIRHGSVPVWDPYTLAGHSFVGETQTGAFDPLHLPLALIPLNHAAVLAPFTYNVWFAMMHVLAACFMFALVRTFELSRFSAFIAGVCFSLGGFVARVGWPDMLDSAIWLPLVFLFFLRALRTASARRAIVNACIGGLMLGMSVLGGRIHVVLMDALVIVSAGIFYACSGPKISSESSTRRSTRFRAAMVVAVLGLTGVAAGAVQLFPSIEYSPMAYRFIGAPGALAGNQKIPYADLSGQFLPQGIALLVAPFAFDGNAGEGEANNPYIGVFPLLAAVIGIRRYWRNFWVRYLAGLAVAAFLFSIGSYSLLHGALYAIVPELWNLREASRIVYIEDFALVILAAHGVDALVKEGVKAGWTGLNRVLLGILIACGTALFVPAVFAKPDINPWNVLSMLLIFASYGLYRYLENGNRGGGVLAIMVTLILFDLSSWNWITPNRMEAAKNRGDYLDRAMSARGAAQFLKSQASPFRVQIQGAIVPNIGDLFEVPIVNLAGGATIPIDYARMMGHTDLLNVRYVLTPATEQRAGAIYQDKDWKVYENPSGYARAWTVHETILEPSALRALALLGTPGFDGHRTALIDVPVALEPLSAGAQETTRVSSTSLDRMELEVEAQSRGLLVLSENYYPGWRATIDDQPAPIYRVDSALRGVVVPRGHSRVVLRYAPASIYWGGLLTILAFVGTLAAAAATK